MTIALDSSNVPAVPAATTVAPVVAVKRRTIDLVLVSLGAIFTVVLFVAGGLLMWGSNFATDYVHKELSAQKIFFSDEAALIEDGRTDLVHYAGQQVTSGNEAKAYASYIDHHLDGIGGGLTYAELGAPEGAAKAALTQAKTDGADAATIAKLQGDVDTIGGQRNSIFKGETLRGLLLSTYAWYTIGKIAGIAAIAAFLAGAAMLVLVVLGFVHYRRVAKV